jgi:hypothetical protein
MSLEIFFVIAAATGRTLVMPPDAPLYLLNKDPSKKERGFADFFPIHTSNFNQKVPVISMEELLRLLALLHDSCNAVPVLKVAGISLSVPIVRRAAADTSPAAQAVREHCGQREHIVASDVMCAAVFLKESIALLADIVAVLCDGGTFFPLVSPVL